MPGKATFEKEVKELLLNTFKASDDIAEIAEASLFRTLVQQEKKYAEDIKKMIERGDKIDQSFVKEFKRTQSQVDAILLSKSGTWSQKYDTMAYMLGRDTVKGTLEAALSVEPSVVRKLYTFSNWQYSKEAKTILSGGKAVARESFTQWNDETAQWLQKTFLDGIEDGIPIGNYTDIGSDRDTIVGRLLKSDTRLRGRSVITKTGGTLHIPAEKTALNIARVEMTRIENEAIVQEGRQVGLRHCYNANPEDSNTTEICRRATKAGVMTFSEMKKKYGFPPRLNPFHLCRSKLVPVRKEWLN